MKIPRAQTHKVIPWEGSRVAAVSAALPDRYSLVAALGAGLGLRQGEIFGLSPEDIDFLRGTVEVQRQVKILNGNRLIFGLPKGNKTRTVPLPASVRELLAAHLSAAPARRVALPWRDLDSDRVSVPLVLSTREAGALNRNYFNTYVWKPALIEAGISPGRENGMHALRHHYASVLLHAGESIRAVSEYLGHSDPGFTLRTYTHLMPDSAARTQNAVDESFARYMGATSTPGKTGIYA